MAEKVIYKMQLRLVLDQGYDAEKDKQIFKTKTFNHVDPAATAEQLHAVGQAFASLQELSVDSIESTEQAAILA